MSDPFSAFVAPARARNQLWRLILGLAVIGLCWIGTTFVVLFGGQFVVPGDRMLAASVEIQDGTTPFGMSVLLLTFLGLLVGPIVAALLLHKRGFRSLTGPFGPLLSDFFAVMPPLLVFYGALILVWHVIFDPVANLEIGVWIMFLPIGLAGIALQTLAEEIAFRGYVMQQLAARFRSPLIWMGVPAFAFGAMHFTGQAGLTVGILIVVATGTFGFVAADLVRKRGNLGAAWGLHLINNSFAILILATDGNLPGLALWLTPYGMETPETLTVMLVADTLTLLLAWQLLLWRLRR